jgi:uncharacterized protein YgiM (DUF1202 family)
MRVLLVVFMLLGSGAVWAQGASVADNVHANLRTGKAENYRILRVLPPKTPVEILTADQDYAKVKTADGQVGWLLLKLLDVEPADQPASTGQDLEAVQHQLRQAHDELARVQDELEQARNRPQPDPIPLAVLLATAFGALAAGVGLGMLILQAYYRRRLHGLRI